MGLTCLLTLGAQNTPGASGNAAAGRALFDGKGGCRTCHSIEDHGGSLGPDLSEIGIKRTPESLKLALTDPNAEIYEEYFTTVVVTKQGQQIEGLALNVDDLSIQLRDRDGNPRSFLRENLKEVRREERSLMPSFASKFSAAEIDDLVAYLRSLKGNAPQPGKATPRSRAIPTSPEDPGWITRPERDGNDRPDSLLDALQIPAGATVADLGSGAGYFTWRLAQRVGPQGRVFAVDIQQAMLDRTAQEVRKHNLANVELVLGGPRDPRLPEASLDLVLIANAYHEFSEPEAMLSAVRRALKPNGRLVVVEHQKEDRRNPLPAPHRMSFGEIRSEIEPAGFELERALDFLPMQHALIFTKRP